MNKIGSKQMTSTDLQNTSKTLIHDPVFDEIQSKLT